MTFPNNYSNHRLFENRTKKLKELSAGQQKRRAVPIKPVSNDENCEGVETLMEASPKANELFGNPGMACNEENKAYEKSGAEMIDENDDESVEEPAADAGAEEDEEEDDLIFHPMHRQAALPAGTYYAVIKEVTAESRVGMYGTFKSIRIRFQIFHDERQVVVNFLAQKDLKPSGKLFKMLKMILGEAPSDGFNLRDLKGEKVVVEVGHRLDSNGDIWEEVLSAEKYSG
ncbi:hypothetical protein SDC9_130084 [bioreactor metagenome]|uniref:DUF669 domain-containing protein n=1 Tax=bioreactor metagenome TaxID=1076179 RepID=A0A645D1K3_9ZZZZ